jgi:hypothetical protein
MQSSWAANAPGTLMQELSALAFYFGRIPDLVREANPSAAWQHAREAVMPHCRKAVA